MDKRTHVLHLIFSFDTERGGGGLTRVATTLAKNLNQKEFAVSIFALARYATDNEKRRITSLQDQGIQVIPSLPWDDGKPYISFYRSTRFQYAHLIKNKVDIIHSHSEFTDISALLLQKCSHNPALVRTIHYGYHQEWRKKPLRRFVLTNLLYPIFFDAEIGVSQAITDRLNQRLLARVLGRKAKRIYNAVELSRFCLPGSEPECIKMNLNIPAESIVVCSIGRLCAQKGHRYLIEAIPTVLTSSPEVYFLIIGEGDLGEELYQQTKELNISPHVVFTGSRSDIARLLEISDIYVSSSLWEGLPLTLLEAMASQVPIVATDIPGTNELLQNQKSALLVPPANPQALSNAIIHLKNNPDLRKKLIHNASERLVCFSIQGITKEYEYVYRELSKQS
jgi:glycosyltransferase involved in cell wall biosynthesis